MYVVLVPLGVQEAHRLEGISTVGVQEAHRLEGISTMGRERGHQGGEEGI